MIIYTVTNQDGYLVDVLGPYEDELATKAEHHVRIRG